MEGRARDGGLRMGEMERDCLITHGCANFIRDRFFVNSDMYRIQVCEQCGMTAHVDNGHVKCLNNKCKRPYKICAIDIPYACKLLFQELEAMCINPRIFTTLQGEKISN